MDSWSGSSRQAPFDLLAEARDGRGADCHVCEEPADRLVELSQGPDENVLDLGSAAFLCATCFQLVSGGESEALERRFTECSPSETAEMAARMITGNVASAPIARY